ncbi:unnamed protein product [Prorocentrum cordatum]|uniref:Uncharacterized protein n=1 Tax=Prorocentrum cordatum TaxID=2364126 RepID=A0ABN9PCJ6_9DINO|nr:unnamed protein product [Polarella glacialis]
MTEPASRAGGAPAQGPADAGRPGFATCQLVSWVSHEIVQEPLHALVVQARFAHVLDRASLRGDAEILGTLLCGDLACASLLEPPWAMVPEGSHVRHKHHQLREGKVELQSHGWLLCSHPRHGDLLTRVPPDWARQRFEEGGFLQLPHADTLCAKLEPHTPATAATKVPRAGFTVKVVAAYGVPWIVEHEQVAVRREPSAAAELLGIMVKGDVVGVSGCRGDWVELARDSEVRCSRPGSGALAVNLGAVSPIRQTSAPCPTSGPRAHGDGGAAVFEDAPAAQAWMMKRHPKLGQLLRRMSKPKGGLGENCVASEARRRLYSEVVGICYRRIYEENLQSLWDGERDKLPSRESLETKLFDDSASIVHVAAAGRLAGGAIVRRFSVRARQVVQGNSHLNLQGPISDLDCCIGRTTIGYIDSCAAEAGLRAGRTIWATLSAMRCVCLACHSILLQQTVDFWRSCGMRKLDPACERDCEEFRKLIMVRTAGRVVCELADVVRELPPSHLPLFVWVSAQYLEDVDGPHAGYVFAPDDDSDA